MTLLLIVLALVAPVAIWSLWRASLRVVYEGPASAIPATVYIGPARPNSPRNAFVAIEIPDRGWLLTDIPAERASSLPDWPQVPVEVVVTKGFLGSPYVSSVKWPGEEKPEAVTRDGGALAAAAVYLLGGFFALAGGYLWVAEAALICSGFICGLTLTKGKKLEPGTVVALTIMCGLMLLGTIVLFKEMTILTFLLGISLAFGFGQVAGMLVGRQR